MLGPSYWWHSYETLHFDVFLTHFLSFHVVVPFCFPTRMMVFCCPLVLFLSAALLFILTLALFIYLTLYSTLPAGGLWADLNSYCSYSNVFCDGILKQASTWF